MLDLWPFEWRDLLLRWDVSTRRFLPHLWPFINSSQIRCVLLKTGPTEQQTVWSATLLWPWVSTCSWSSSTACAHVLKAQTVQVLLMCFVYGIICVSHPSSTSSPLHHFLSAVFYDTYYHFWDGWGRESRRIVKGNAASTTNQHYSVCMQQPKLACYKLTCGSSPTVHCISQMPSV